MRQAISTASAPQAIGPYSQAIRTGSLLFVSGPLAIDPANGQVVTGDIASQTRRVLDNLRGILEAAGTSFDAVVRTTVYMADLAEFGAMNEVYGQYFTAPAPARSTVQVARLPRDVKVEIDAIADLGK